MNSCTPDPRFNQPHELGNGAFVRRSRGVEDLETVQELREVAEPIESALVDLRSSARYRRSSSPRSTRPIVEPSTERRWLVGPYSPESDSRQVVSSDGQVAQVEVTGNGPSEPGSKSRVVLDELNNPIVLLPAPKGPDEVIEEDEPIVETIPTGKIKGIFQRVEYQVNGVWQRVGSSDPDTKFRVSKWIGGDRETPIEIWNHEQIKVGAEILRIRRCFAHSTGINLNDWSVYSEKTTKYGDFPQTEEWAIDYVTGSNKATEWHYFNSYIHDDPYEGSNRGDVYFDFLDYYGYGLVLCEYYVSWVAEENPSNPNIVSSDAGFSIDFSEYSLIDAFGGLSLGVSYNAQEDAGETGLIVNGSIVHSPIGNYKGQSSWSHDPNYKLSTFSSNITYGIPSATVGSAGPPWGGYSVLTYGGGFTSKQKALLPEVTFEEIDSGSCFGQQGSGGRHWDNYWKFLYVRAISPKHDQALIITWELEGDYDTDNEGNNNYMGIQTWKWQLYDKTTDNYTVIQEFKIRNYSDLEGGWTYTGTVLKCEPVPLYPIGSEAGPYGYYFEDDDYIPDDPSSLASKFFNTFGAVPQYSGSLEFPAHYWGGESEFVPDYYERLFCPTLYDSKFYKVRKPLDTTWEQIYNEGGDLTVEVYSLPLSVDMTPESTITQRVEPIKIGGFTFEDTDDNASAPFQIMFEGYWYCPN